jgi:DNA polymerase elongation subunit (family B)
MGLRVIYGDTDSLMIWFAKSKSAEQTLEWLKEVSTYINKESGILGNVGILKMGMEDISSMLLCGKKMYVKYAMGIEDGKLKKPKIKIVGLDNRSKTPHVRKVMRRMVEAVFVEGKTDVSDMYEKAVQDVALGKLDKKELKHTSELGKSLDLYETQAHAVAARQMVAKGLSVEIGDRIEYYVCNILNAGDKKADSVVAGVIVDSDGYELDWKSYAEETIKALKPFKAIIKEYEKLSNIRYYHLRVGAKRSPPPQPAHIVGTKRKVMTPQAGPMDGFVKRIQTEPTKKSRVHKARGRDLSEMDLD